MIVNENNKVKNLSQKQLTDLYTGKIKDWSAVGGDKQTVSCIGREAGSGTRDGFEHITGTDGKSVLSQELTSTGAVIESVKNSKNAIGYASYSSVTGKKGIKIISINGVSCSEKTISDKTYKIQRDFNLITRTDKKLSEKAQEFFDFITSEKAHELIKKAGVVPVVK